jgi:hypothetical protein
MEAKITISLSYGEARSLLAALPSDDDYGFYCSEKPLYDLKSTLREILGE